MLSKGAKKRVVSRAICDPQRFRCNVRR